MSDDQVMKLRDAVTDAPKELFYNADYQYQHARHITLSPPTTDFPFVEYVPAARIEELVADFNRQAKRTDEQREAYEARMQEMEADHEAALAEVTRLTALLREAEGVIASQLAALEEFGISGGAMPEARALLARLEAREVK